MDDERIAALLQAHLARYPVMEIADVYKLLHQAVFGPGHAVPNKKTAREWLEHETSVLAQAGDAALVEIVHPDGALVRVHLHPYAACGGQIKWLLNAMVRSAGQVTGDPDVMVRWWAIFARMCEPGAAFAGHFPARELMLFGKLRAQERWPAVHHSPAFVDAYHPAYRVLTAQEAEALCERLRMPYAPV